MKIFSVFVKLVVARDWLGLYRTGVGGRDCA